MNGDLVTDVSKYRRGWVGGRPETPCGYGSMLENTAIQREWIPRMVGKYGIHSIADIGAGDLNWIKEVHWPHPVNYRPYDLVPRATCVEPLDIIHEVPERADLLMCLWVLNHFPEEHQDAAAANIAASGCKYVLYTYWPAMLARMDWGADESVVIRPRIKAEMRLIRADRLDNLLGR